MEPAIGHNKRVTDCSFKDLCLDAVDPQLIATFWGKALGREVRRTPDSGYRVGPSSSLAPFNADTDGIWVDPVAEPRSGKTRVHLDLRLPNNDPRSLISAGADLISGPSEERLWWVLADAEGNTFCAMPPPPDEYEMTAVGLPTAFALVVDCVEPASQAVWWAERTGGNVATRAGTTAWWVENARGFPFPYWVFTEVPEAKTVKNRMHWDVLLSGSDITPLLDAGAQLLRKPDDEIWWWVLADPEGNEFCAFDPARP